MHKRLLEVFRELVDNLVGVLCHEKKLPLVGLCGTIMGHRGSYTARGGGADSICPICA